MQDDDTESWEKAWQSRDAAFDGRFFIGVRTTGVYCRCVCPVRLPLRYNIDFLPSAAAAEAAGFRPCLRCRPEAAPFSPAWNSTRTTVERAARLIIEDGALDGDATVEALAARLGVTSRHLNRLFVRHWGTSPSIVARTARVQRAKRLLNETNLPMLEVALQAGFGSLRRFNAVFAEIYKLSPGDIRRRKSAESAVTVSRPFSQEITQPAESNFRFRCYRTPEIVKRRSDSAITYTLLATEEFGHSYPTIFGLIKAPRWRNARS